MIFQRKSALLGIPLSFFLLGLSGIRISERAVLWVFIASVLGFDLYALLRFLYVGIDPHFLAGGYAYAIRESIGAATKEHPSYLGLFSISAALLSFILFFDYKSNIKKILLLCAAIFLIAFTVLISARMPLLLFVVCFAILMIKRLKASVYIPLLSGSFLLLLALVMLTPMKSRIMEVASLRSQNISNEKVDGTSIRTVIAPCSFDLLSENWLIGCGPDVLQDELNECYYSSDIELFRHHDYNTHNEYLNVWLGLGLFAFFLFLFMLGRSFLKLKPGSAGFLCFLMFLGLCLTENVLDRQIGTFFFAIWYSYYLIFKPIEFESEKQGLK